MRDRYATRDENSASDNLNNLQLKIVNARICCARLIISRTVSAAAEKNQSQIKEMPTNRHALASVRFRARTDAL